MLPPDDHQCSDEQPFSLLSVRVNCIGAHFMYLMKMDHTARALGNCGVLSPPPALDSVLVENYPVSSPSTAQTRRWDQTSQVHRLGCFVFVCSLLVKPLCVRTGNAGVFPLKYIHVGATLLLFSTQLAFMVGGSCGEFQCLDDLGIALLKHGHLIVNSVYVQRRKG